MKEEQVVVHEKSLFLTAREVAVLMSVSVPMAYKIIKRLNDELDSQGFLTISGKVNRRYFESKIFGGIEEGSEHASV